MIGTPVIEPKISPFIPQQFPVLYQNDDPKFILFVQNFYQWLEQDGNPLYYSRNFPILNDVDLTTENILTFIKQKYFLNIQLSTQANIRQIVKHCLDIYRSKGTQRCIDLLFRLVFDEVIDFYYPKDDIMKLSSGNWYIPKYIELTLNKHNSQLFQKKIQGLISGATAFVDGVVKTNAHGRLISVIYISAIEGDFQTGETIFPTDNSIALADCPTMIGSLTDLEVSAQGSGLNFDIGDIININSNFGEGAVGLVTGIVDTVGELSFELEDGGYAYSNSTSVNIANAHLQLKVTNFANTYARRYFEIYENIVQPLGEINFSNAVWTGNTFLVSNGVPLSNVRVPFAVGNYIATSNDNTTLALIVNSTSTLNVITNTYFGSIIFQTLTGTCDADPVFEVNVASNGNLYYVASANHTPLSNGYTDVSAIGQFIGLANVALGITNSDGFTVGEQIIQYNLAIPGDQTPIGLGFYTGLTSNNEMVIEDLEGVFRVGPIRGMFSNNTANVTFLLLTPAILRANNNFVENPPISTVYSASINAIMTNKFDVGGGASLTFSNNLNFPSEIQYNTDRLSDYLGVLLSASSYGLPGNTSANSASVINSALTYEPVIIGSLTSFNVSPGSGYQFEPLIYVDDIRTRDENAYDTSLKVTDASLFLPGLQVSQASSNALGRITRIDLSNNIIHVRNFRFSSNQQFVITANDASQLVEGITNQTTNVVNIAENRDVLAQGRNAQVQASAAIGNGSLLSMKVLYSGFGYINDEQVWMDKNNIQGDNTAFGVTSLKTIGKGQGFYKDRNGFLSDSKKLYDGFYYQTFSYEIQSSTVMDKYEKLIKQIAHPSGIMMFGRIVHKTKVNTSPIIHNSIISYGPVLSIDPTPYILKLYPRGLLEDKMSLQVNNQSVQLLYGHVLVAGGASVTENINLTGMPIVQAQFPTTFADFNTNNYYFTGNQYGSFSSWMTAIGGTYTRSSNATYTQAGVIKTALANTLRFPTDLNSKPLGIRLTGPGTNILLHSGIDGSWTSTAGTTVSNNATGPDGIANSAHTFTPNTTSTNHGISLSSGTLFTANTYTISMFAKNAGYNFLAIDAVNGGAAGAQYAIFDLTTGAIVRGANTVGASVTQLANGWWLCALTSVMPAATKSTTFLPFPANTYSAYAGNGSGICVFGAQATLSTFVLDYIPSGTANGVQTFDLFTIPYAQTVFTALLKTANLNYVAASQRLIGANTGNAPIYLASNTFFGLYGSALSSIVSPTFSNNVFTSNAKVMVTGNSTFRSITADGLTPNSSANAIVSAQPTNFYLGSDGTSSSITGTYGNILHIGLWNNLVANTTEMQNNTL